MIMKVGFFDQAWVSDQRQKANPKLFSKALVQLLAAANPYGSGSTTTDKEDTEIECCICIGAIAPFQALFISPCSHIYHHKCVSAMISQSAMFQCPLCRQVANLTASISSDSLHVPLNTDNCHMVITDNYNTSIDGFKLGPMSPADIPDQISDAMLHSAVAPSRTNNGGTGIRGFFSPRSSTADDQRGVRTTLTTRIARISQLFGVSPALSHLP